MKNTWIKNGSIMIWKENKTINGKSTKMENNFLKANNGFAHQIILLVCQHTVSFIFSIDAIPLTDSGNSYS